MSKQKSYTKEYKFKVAIEMVKGDLTMAEIISKYYNGPHKLDSKNNKMRYNFKIK